MTTMMRIALLGALTASCMPAEDEGNHPWSGIRQAQVVVQGDGVTTYNAEAIKALIELELRKAGLPCITGLEPAVSAAASPTATVIARVDGLLVHDRSGMDAGCVYHWSLTASTWARRVVDGGGAVVLEEHHNIGFGPTRELPADFSSGFIQLSDTLVTHWVRDNPK